MLKSLTFIFFCLVFCSAIPNEHILSQDKLSPSSLTRPAPINPEIPGDPKPKDKIIPIPEGQHDIKQKRESDPNKSETEPTTSTTPSLPGPLNLQNHEHLPLFSPRIQYKRDSSDKTGSSSNPPSTLVKDNKESNHNHEHEHQNPHDPNNQHKRDSLKEQPATTDTPKQVPSSSSSEVKKMPYVPPSPLLKIYNKRDIPVPVTESHKETTTKNDKNSGEQNTQHPAVLSQPVPVAELLKNNS